MEKQRNKPMWVLFAILLGIFCIGMINEIVLKYVQIRQIMHPADPVNVITNRLARAFGDESLPVWAVPALLLNWIVLVPREPGTLLLRWIPYLIAFLLPVLCALLRKKEIPLILCAIGAGVVSIGLVLVRFFSARPYISVLAAVPFGIECLLLILASVAIGAKKKGFAITLGVIAFVLALLSPVVSAFFAGLTSGGSLPKGYPISAYISTQMRRFPLSAGTSLWPIYKAFAFVMYGLILVTAPKRFAKRG